MALEQKLADLRNLGEDESAEVSRQIAEMEQQIAETRQEIYGTLSAWEKIQIARHPQRPYTGDYIRWMTRDFVELHGDRLYADDRAIIGGFATLDQRRVMLIGTQKGRDTKSNLACNFGSPFPEGYRKARRLFRLADKFRLPIVVLIDTPGAFPGIESEERHVAEAIAVNLRESFDLGVPMVAVVTGEGGSGGALGLSVADRILLLEYAYYSVITPEGCAAILWKDRAYADQAAAALKCTAPDLLELGISDGIVPEPPGGAHHDPEGAARILKQAILDTLNGLLHLSSEALRNQRYRKFRAIGQFEEQPPEEAAEESLDPLDHAAGLPSAGEASTEPSAPSSLPADPAPERIPAADPTAD